MPLPRPRLAPAVGPVCLVPVYAKLRDCFALYAVVYSIAIYGANAIITLFTNEEHR